MKTNPKRIPEEVDVLIIGSGIGGLTCANYLAKAGLRVLVVEKHHTVGGYSSSFYKGAYYFDAGAHYLGSCRPEGQIGKLITDHGLEKYLSLIHCDPSEVIVTQNHSIYIRSSSEIFVQEFERAFPKERQGLRQFVKYLTDSSPMELFADLHSLTFENVLDRYFQHWEIKSAFSTLLGNIGLPSSHASALTSAFLYREFIFDGGYYPKGGMQAFADALRDRFEDYGGVCTVLSPANSINIDSLGRVKSVKIRHMGRQDVEIKTKIVVANCDPMQLFERLLVGNDSFKSALELEYQHRKPSVSAFMVHLGISHDISETARYKCNIWSYRKGHIDEYYKGVMDGKVDRGQDSFLFCSIPTFHDQDLLPVGRHSIQAIIAAPYRDRAFWEPLREELADDVINRIDQFIPGISDWIDVEQVAIPPTLVKYTSNYHGAMYGWASVPLQVGKNRIPEKLSIEGLYMVGHWTGLPSGHSGIPTVVTSGRNVARLVLRDCFKSKK